MPALGLDFERSISATVGDVRRAIVDGLKAEGFDVTAEQLTRIEAKRGSRLLGGSLMPARTMPILVWFDLVPSPAGCVVEAHFVDQHFNVGGKAWGLNQTYEQLFAQVHTSIDRMLARLDPAGAASFGPARFWTKGGDVSVLEQVSSAGVQLGTTVAGRANDVLSGARDDRPSVWKGIDSVSFISPRGWAVLSLPETQAHLGVATMISAQPGTLPANLARELEAFAMRVEQALTNSGGNALCIELSEQEQPVLEFLHQQVQIRDGLPIRTLHVCRACHMQKITNEDFARIQTRNQRLRGLVSGVGATLSSGGIQPFVIFGQLFKLKQLDPDYVCPRCQGLDADEMLVTFCPQCGDLRREPVLRECRKCKFDFRTRLKPESFWLSAEAAAPLAGLAGSAGPVGPVGLGGQVSASSPAPAADNSIVAAATDGSIVAAATEAAHVAVPSDAPAFSFCPFCGAQLLTSFAFCPACGNRLEALVSGNRGT